MRLSVDITLNGIGVSFASVKGSQTMPTIERLLQGFSSFRETYFENDNTLFEQLSREGQKPSTLLISCSDSRVDPAILFGVEPGDLFIVRNVANLVPPYEPDARLHGTSSAIEFAVRDLEVSHIITLGHSNCGGIHALCRHLQGNDWSEILSNAGCQSQRMRSSLMCVMNLPVPSKRRFVHRLKI